MALSVIGAGFGGTGTMSLKLALEQLGIGPCHHMKDVIEQPEQLASWQAAAAGGKSPQKARATGMPCPWALAACSDRASRARRAAVMRRRICPEAEVTKGPGGC